MAIVTYVHRSKRAPRKRTAQPSAIAGPAVVTARKPDALFRKITGKA